MNAWVQFFFLPLTAFVYSLDFVVRTLQTFQQTAQQLVPATPNPGSLPPAGGGLDRSTPIGGALRGGATTTLKEVRKMSDCGCNDQCGEKFCEVRVYEYYILSIRPCHEEVVYGPTSIVVTSNMSGEAFSTYAIAMYCQDPENKITKENAQYLRVCYRINCTFPKERQDCCSTYNRDQVEVLREIRDALRGGPPEETAETTPAPRGGGGRRGAAASA